MVSLLEYCRLIVPEYIPMGITGLLVGAIATTGTLPDSIFWLAVLCFAFVIAGYNSYNAIIDKEIDIINKPQRPLPSKTLTERDALKVAIFCYLVALILAILIDAIFLLVILLTVLITVAYSHPVIHLKRRFLIGTLTAVVLYTVLAPLAGWALYSSNPIPLPIIFFLFFLGIPKGIMKDYVDIAGDSFHRIRSVPVQLGYLNSVLVVLMFYILSAAFLIFLVFENIIPQTFLLILALFLPMFYNVKNLPQKYNPYIRQDRVFINAMVLLILTEILITILILLENMNMLRYN